MSAFDEPSTTEVYTIPHRCDKTVFMPVLAFMVTTVLAQIVLTLRFVTVNIEQLQTNHD